MSKIWLAKIFYYLFYAVIFFIAVIIFIEIMNIDILKSEFGNFFINLFQKMQF
jgi:hypothetical protein